MDNIAKYVRIFFSENEVLWRRVFTELQLYDVLSVLEKLQEVLDVSNLIVDCDLGQIG